MVSFCNLPFQLCLSILPGNIYSDGFNERSSFSKISWKFLVMSVYSFSMSWSFSVAFHFQPCV